MRLLHLGSQRFFRIAAVACAAVPSVLHADPERSNARVTAGSAAHVEAIEKRAIEARQALSAGTIVLLCRHERYSNAPDYETYSRKYTLYFDGPKVRQDRVHQRGDAVLYADQIAWTPKQCIKNWGGRAPDGSLLPMQIQQADQCDIATMDVVRPELVGMVLAPTLLANRPATLRPLERSDRRNVAVVDDSVDGEPAKRVSFDLSQPRGIAHIAVWIAPQLGYSVLRMRAVCKPSVDNGHNDTFEITMVPKQWPPRGLWYPSSATYAAATNGTVVEREVTTVESLAYDRPPSDETFTLSGLAIPEGRRALLDNYWAMVWTKNRLEREVIGAPVPPAMGTLAPKPRSKIAGLLIANAVVLAIVGGILLLRLRHRHRGTQ